MNDGLRIPPRQPKNRTVTQIDESVFKKLSEFGLGDEEARASILSNKITSQAFVLYNLILEHNEKEEEKERTRQQNDPLGRRKDTNSDAHVPSGTGEIQELPNGLVTTRKAATTAKDDTLRRRHGSCPPVVVEQTMAEVDAIEKMKKVGITVSKDDEIIISPKKRQPARPRRTSLLGLIMRKKGDKEAKERDSMTDGKGSGADGHDQPVDKPRKRSFSFKS